MLLSKSVVQNKLLHGSQSWSNLSTTDINRLNISYNNGLEQILSVPTSTPNCSAYLELGVILTIYEIKKRRLDYFYNFIQNNKHMVQNIKFLILFCYLF